MFFASRSDFACSRVRPLSRAARIVSVLAALSVFGLALTGCDGSSRTGTTGTGGTGGLTPAAGSGTLNITFSNPSGTNANTAAFSTSAATPALGVGAGGLNNLAIQAAGQSAGSLRTFQVILDTSGTPVIGKAYTTADNGSSEFGVVTYSQTAISGTTTGTPAAWTSSGGSIIVDSITGKNYKLRLVDVQMTTGDSNDSSATGSFTLNGSANVTLP